MRTWAIGDLQGCDEALQRLLLKIQFRPGSDQLLFCGDLVNRGPDSLAVLRRLRALGDSANSVLGNHDLHCLAIAHGHGRLKHKDTLQPLLDAEDAPELLDWLLHRPLLLEAAGHLIVHAGVPPVWDRATALGQATACCSEMQADPGAFFARMYGNDPAHWRDATTSTERHRYTINALTRMRYCHADGGLDFADKLDPAQSSLTPWFAHPQRRALEHTVVFGHWSTLGQVTWPAFKVVGLDTGCVWGGPLTAYCLETGELRSVSGLDKAVPIT